MYVPLYSILHVRRTYEWIKMNESWKVWIVGGELSWERKHDFYDCIRSLIFYLQLSFFTFLETGCVRRSPRFLNQMCHSHNKHTRAANTTSASTPHLKKTLTDQSASSEHLQQPINVHALPHCPMNGCVGRDLSLNSRFLVRNACPGRWTSFIQIKHIISKKAADL